MYYLAQSKLYWINIYVLFCNIFQKRIFRQFKYKYNIAFFKVFAPDIYMVKIS